MKHVLRFCLTTLWMLAVVVSTASADEKASVRVALLDISSITPVGMMPYGMMGPGTMMGPGMMGAGMMGQGQGTGNAGPGVIGSGMMMGMMAVRMDQPTVKAGTVAFDVTNWSRSIVHEVLVISVDNPTAPLPYDYAQARVPEEQVKCSVKRKICSPTPQNRLKSRSLLARICCSAMYPVTMQRVW